MDKYLNYPTDGERPWQISYERYNIKADIDMPPTDSSLLEMFEDSFERYANETAYLYENQRISYRELNHLSQNIAAYLQGLGLQKGDSVGVMLPNILHYPIVVMAVIRAGLTLVSFNPNYTPRELEHQIADSEICLLVMMDKLLPTYKQLDGKATSKLRDIVICRKSDIQSGRVANLWRKTHQWLQSWVSTNTSSTNQTDSQNLIQAPHRRAPHRIEDARTAYPAPSKNNEPAQSLDVTYHSFSRLLYHAEPYTRPSLQLDDKVLIQYTGGTTGIAKGAILTHGNLIANLLQIDNLLRSAFDEEGQGDIILTALPLYHVFSFTIGCMLVVFRGFTGLLIANPKDVTKLVEQLQAYPPSYILGVNPLFSGFLKHPKFSQVDFSRIKATIGGGMPTSPTLAKRWQEVTGVPIIEGYGLSETSPVVTFNPLTAAEFSNKVGIPAPSTDVLLVDEHDRPVPIGERGEIVIKGPQVMQGYQNRPEDTAQAFTKHGYLRSGDIAIMDEQGFIKIVDRKKDMIVVSGFNVYPAEIESVMIEHPDVVECAAIGVPHSTRGEEPKIFVVTHNPKLTAEELIDYGKRHLTAYKRPRHVTFVDSLPKTTVGKLLRRELRKREGLE